MAGLLRDNIFRRDLGPHLPYGQHQASSPPNLPSRAVVVISVLKAYKRVCFVSLIIPVVTVCLVVCQHQLTRSEFLLKQYEVIVII